jgi:DnaJ family protein C protein 3
VLQLKPGHEGALVQRAKLRARQGEWTEAEADYAAAGKKKDAAEIAELHGAHGAAIVANSAAASGNWEECIQQSGTAIMVAAGDVLLRNLRAKCRFERGELAEGISDLQHVLHINPGSVEPHIKVSTLQFFGLGETEAGLAQIRRCLQSDPESKACKKVMKSEKNLEKQVKKVKSLMEKKQNVAATKILVQNGQEPGLLQEVKNEFEVYKKEGVIHANTPNGLYANLLESTCEAYVEVCTFLSLLHVSIY